MTTRLLPFAIAFALACGTACTGDSTGQSETQDVIERGTLDWNEPVEAELTRDFEYHAYSFDVAAGSRISLEITHKGSSMGLATVMVLYGPEGKDAERERIAVDYDSGWGRLSKLAGLTLAQGGNYTVTVGSASGLDQGRYRLLLTCDAGNCAEDIAPLELVEGDPNTEFMETFNFYESDSCYRWGRAFSYPKDTQDASLLRAAAAIMDIHQQENELGDNDILEYGGEISLMDFDSWLRDPAELDRDTFEGAVGIMSDDTYLVGEVLYEHNTSDESWRQGAIMVTWLPDWHQVWTVEFGCHYGQ